MATGVGTISVVVEAINEAQAQSIANAIRTALTNNGFTGQVTWTYTNTAAI